MRLLIQPGDGITPLIKGISAAKSSIEIIIFRFDQGAIEQALAHAINRGVAVHALIAHTNRAGEDSLRRLEMRLLEAGALVSRTADDLVRYHGKAMIVDRRDLYLLAFNLTRADIEHSRSFGIVTSSRKLVSDAVRLFEADATRQTYEGTQNGLVVSPVNARKRLAGFIQGARKELLIYDPKVSDPAMISLLQERARAGVEIRIIGRLSRKISGVKVSKLPQMRLHTRTTVRDGRLAFVGSQSLRAIELDARREIGMIVHDPDIIRGIVQTFEADWGQADAGDQPEEPEAAVRVAKRVAKAVTRSLPPVGPVLDGVMKSLVGQTIAVDLNPEEVEELVKDAVKEAVKEVVEEVVEEAVEQAAEQAVPAKT